MADILAPGYLSSADMIKYNREKYADKFKDSNEELITSETFLNLLVAEMTNQDPLEPTSNTEFVTQMATMTQLQYAKDSSINSLGTYASSLVGKTVTASKMDGANLVTQTGVVTEINKVSDTEYNFLINGVTFSLSNIKSVSTTVDSDSQALSGSSLGDSISRASLMIGMYATVNPKTASGSVLDAGVIESVQVKNGEISVVINGIAYKLSDVVEVRYQTLPDVEENETAVDAVEEPAEENVATDTDDVTEEVLEEETADEEVDEDVEDLEDISEDISDNE
ncbi:MAG: flagellar hook assembly protein FlgD [Oscillospiraceae bacterium]